MSLELATLTHLVSKFIKFYPPVLKRKTTFDKFFVNKDKSFLNTKIRFGDFGILLCEKLYIKPKQVQSILFFIRKKIKGLGEVRFRSFPLRRITMKGAGQRMGRGKGKPSGIWFFCGKAGAIILEISCSLMDLTFFIENVFSNFKQMFRTKIRLLFSYDEKVFKDAIFAVK